MASIVKIKDKRSGITYVYESESYWDKEKKAPRNKRTLIGKIDPETGEMIPTDGRRKKKTDVPEEGMTPQQKQLIEREKASLAAMEDEYLALVEKQKKELEQLASQMDAMIRRLDTIQKSFRKTGSVNE